MKEKNKDIVSATKEEIVSTALESDGFQETVTWGAEQLLEGAAGSFVGAMLSAIAPRVNGVYLSYKNKRFERSVKRAVEVLNGHVSLLESNYAALTEEMKNLFSSDYLEMLLDHIIDERLQKKIDWNVIGFVRLMDNNTAEESLQLFFDTLSSLTPLDVDMLRIYNRSVDYTQNDVVNKYNLTNEQFWNEKEKLV